MFLKKLVIFLLLIPLFATSQTKETSNAFEIFDNLEYYKAINLLEKAYIKEKDERFKAEIVFKLGESYRNMAMYAEALPQYERAMILDYGPDAEYYYGKMLQMLGRYEEAELILKEYLEESPSDKRVIELLKSIKLAQKLEKEKTDYKLRNIRELNTAYNDFAPSFFGVPGSDNVLVFTSTRLSKNSTKEDEWLGTGFSNIYKSSLERKGNDFLNTSSRWSQAVSFDDNINSLLHEGATSFTKNRDEVYFTRCDYDDNKASGCGIYYSKLVNGKWSEPIAIIEANSDIVAGHPAISPSGKKLVYSANGPNSIGGNDLYMLTKKKDGSWSETPKNLGRTINTKGNEMYPWIDEKENLYFSSDGHPGLGGLDVFISKIGTRNWGKPTNLKIPINSASDDFGIVFNSDKSKGFISSNRPGGRGRDDLYEIRLLPFMYTLKGKVIDVNTGKILPNVQIKIEGNDGSVNFTTSDNKGKFQFGTTIIKSDVTYKLVSRHRKYLAQVTSFSTLGIPMEEFEPTENGYLSVSNLDIEMDHISVPVVLPHIEYDFNSAELRKVSEEGLDQLVEVLGENPDIIISLRSHTDHIGGDKFNLKLSQARAQSCVNYLIAKDVDPKRLIAEGMGETEPYEIPENFESSFAPGTILTEQFIKSLDKNLEEEARQYNRRTDFKVLGEMVKRAVDPLTVNDSIPDLTMVIEIDTVDTSMPIVKEEKGKPVIFYELIEKDNYGTVASKFNITVKELKSLNGGLRATHPFVGLKLKISLTADYSDFDKTHYRLQRADNTFEKILKKTGLTEDEFFDLNPDFFEENLRPGTLVKIKESK
jgi:peptidoglycan-associated lipoprotein